MTDAATTVTAVLPLWLEIIVAVLVLAGAALALLGSIGLLRLPTFFERVHTPSIIATLGCWLIMHGTVLYFSVANRSLSAGHLVLGTVLALAIPLLTAGLRPLPVRIRKPGTVLRLALTVVADTTRSNLAVARLLLAPGRRRHPAGFVHIPLDVRDPNALAVLAMIVCITPGTAWAEISLDRSMLLLHVLEVDDAQAIAADVKQRYERPLMEIFE